MGGRYQIMLELVHEAKRQGLLQARVAVDALPNTHGLIEKQIEDATRAVAASRRRVATPLPELFANRLSQDDDQEEGDDAGLAAAQAQERRAREESKEPSVWSRMMPWNLFKQP
jgi:hypothetical protein